MEAERSDWGYGVCEYMPFVRWHLRHIHIFSGRQTFEFEVKGTYVPTLLKPLFFMCTFLITAGMSKERSGGGVSVGNVHCAEYLRTLTDMKVPIEELKFEDIIGRGSFAVVHKGMWKGAQVALKCISVPGSISAGIPKEVEILR